MLRKCCGCLSAKQKVQPGPDVEAPQSHSGRRSEDAGKPGGLLRGISCKYLAGDLLQEMENVGLARSSPVYAIEESVIRKKGEKLICPKDNRLGTSYVDALADGDAGLCNYMLSYSWGYPVGDIADTLSDFFGEESLHEFIWICCLCINQHRVKEAQAAGQTVSFAEFEEAFGRRVEGVGHILAMMSPWQEPRYIRRVWCVFEFSIAIKERKELTVLMPQAEKDSFRLALFETGLQGIYDVLASLRIQDASASVEEDKINILKSIDPDAIDYNDSAKVGALNTKVRQRIQQWLVNTAVQWLEDRTREAPAEVKHSVFNSVGSLLIESVADFSNAEVILRQGLEVHSKQSLDGALGLRLLGRLVVRRQDWEGARSYYMEAKAMLESLGSARTVQYAQLLVDLFTTTGQEEFLFSAKELFDSLEATSHEDYPRVLKHLGSLKLAGGDAVGAMEYYELAADSYQELKMERSPGFADLLTNLGKAEMECASRDKAREAYEASKHIYGVIGVTESPGYADLLVNLGMLHKEEDRVSEALAEFKAAASIYATSSPGGTALPELWAQIGSCHEKRGAFEVASEAYEVARVLFEKAGETEHDTYKEVLARSQAHGRTDAAPGGQGPPSGGKGWFVPERW